MKPETLNPKDQLQEFRLALTKTVLHKGEEEKTEHDLELTHLQSDLRGQHVPIYSDSELRGRQGRQQAWSAGTSIAKHKHFMQWCNNDKRRQKQVLAFRVQATAKKKKVWAHSY